MPKPKHAQSQFIKTFHFVGKFLVAIGTPPLVALEFLLLTIISLGNRTITLASKLRPPKLGKFSYFLFGALSFFLFVFVPFFLQSELSRLPDPHLLESRDIPVSTKIYDRSGLLLYQIYSDENRTLVSLKDLPSYLPAAHLAIEDKNFYSHPGFDPVAITRAVLANTLQPETKTNPQGASTITQQLVKSALLSPEKTFSRKIKEIILAFWAERIYSKDQILTMYLNQVPYGGAAYGIESAAQTYFGKKAKDLTLSEAALLAGLPSAPTLYSPLGAYPELAKNRQHQVLDAMLSQKVITSKQWQDAKNADLKFIGLETGIKAPHFIMFVRDFLVQKYGPRLVEQGGLEVTTSLDLPLYEKTLSLLKNGVLAQKNLKVGNGAALITNPTTGEILAMVGSIDYFDKSIDGNVNITTSARSPGSSIKPVTYALAFEKKIITPETPLSDTPVSYKIPGQPDYSPRNYDDQFHGTVSAKIALASSYNVPAVKLLEKVGVENLRQFAQNLGITTWDDPNRFGLSLTLGGGEVKMADMAVAYSTFANLGKKVSLNPVLLVKDYKGNILEKNDPQSETIISPQTASLINSILSDNSARTPAFGPGSTLAIPGRAVAVKTGTTETKRDNWTIGYTFDNNPRLVAVWVGNNDNSPMSPFLESGNTGAAAIWNPIMKLVLQ